MNTLDVLNIQKYYIWNDVLHILRFFTLHKSTRIINGFIFLVKTICFYLKHKLSSLKQSLLKVQQNKSGACTTLNGKVCKMPTLLELCKNSLTLQGANGVQQTLNRTELKIQFITRYTSSLYFD